jgi:HD-like signal output (HDOD) protein
VNLLGIQRVRLTAQALITMQDTSSLVEGFNWKHLWIHSFACALLADEVPKRLLLGAPENAYLAGLLHDLGKILLSYLDPTRYRKLLMEAICDGTPLEELEQRFFGLTHEEAGGEFARCNRLPEGVVAAMEWHQEPEKAGEHQIIAASINVANFLAKTHGLGFSGSPLAQMEASLGETPGWRILSAAMPRPIDPMEFHLQLRPFISDLKHELHTWIATPESGD